MRTLHKTLQDQDLGHLHILAEAWGLELPPGTFPELLDYLIRAMLDEKLMEEILEGLPSQADQALRFLVQLGGRTSFSDLTRRFGPLREMGTGRRDRLKPWQDPISPLEVLWYRGLVSRAFADTPTGPQELAFIPTEILEYLLKGDQKEAEPFGDPASLPKHVQLASDMAIDDATSLLADLRRQPAKADRLDEHRLLHLEPFLLQPPTLDLLFMLLNEMNILTLRPLQPAPDATRQFLDLPKEQALARLIVAWRDSKLWNDLQHCAPLAISSQKWPNDPLSTRQVVLQFLRRIPRATWWELQSFLAAIRERHPGYQRPGGDFDSWYLQDALSGEFLRGFRYWDEVDGSLLRFMLCGPLHWLGASDIGSEHPHGPPTAFRLTRRFEILFGGLLNHRSGEKPPAARITAEGKISIPRSASESLRYQIARICDWVSCNKDGFTYLLNPVALNRASHQGLQIKQIRSILERLANQPLPHSLLEAISRWEQYGREAYLESVVVLRGNDAKVMERLQENKKTARYIREIITPTIAIIRESEWEKLYSAAIKSGIFIDGGVAKLERPPS